jgi:hypothetical protein
MFSQPSRSVKNLRRFNLFTVIALAGVLTPASVFASESINQASNTAIHQIIHASQKSPQLVIPGDIVDVDLNTGATEVQLQGPMIPQVSADALPGTFIFHFRQKKGKTLISIRDIGIIDGEGTLIRPIKFDDGTASFFLTAGQTRTLKLTTFMAVGTGTLRWAPLNHYVADWQFVEETA